MGHVEADRPGRHGGFSKGRGVMEHLDFELRLTTPAFLGGGQGADGFRIPALRGALRFWFRAKEGDSGDKASERLFERESEIFGSARHGQGLRLVPRGRMDVELEPPSMSNDLKYLAFGPFGPVSKKAKKLKLTSRKRAIPPGSSFQLRACGREDQLDELRRCLLLLHLFGGLGGRSRRGWGSVEVVGGDVVPASEGSFEDWLGRCFERVWPAPKEAAPGRTRLPRFTAFSAKTRVGSLEAGGRWRNALEKLSGIYKEVAGRDPEASEEESLRTPDGEGEERTAAPQVALGLPWKGKETTEPRDRWAEYGIVPAEGEPENQDLAARRATPVLFKVSPSDSGGHRIVALYLEAQFLSRGRLARNGDPIGPPSDRAIDRLFDHFTTLGWPPAGNPKPR